MKQIFGLALLALVLLPCATMAGEWPLPTCTSEHTCEFNHVG
jgi:hypothetical protein